MLNLSTGEAVLAQKGGVKRDEHEGLSQKVLLSLDLRAPANQ